MKLKTDYDIAIIGSGIAGSMLGAILARHGQRVVIFEAKSHPRFAIGESLILETSEMMRALADMYDVPELAYFSSENFAAFSGTTHGIKRHFGFLHHTEGQVHDPRRTLQAVIPNEPHGHELHLYRQDTDYFFMSTAVHYGAAVFQNTPVADIEVSGDYVNITAERGIAVTAQYVVDAGGFRSVLAQKFGLRVFDLQTHSRAIFTHMINVPAFHEGADYDLPFRMAEGTLHHIFDGGWLWVIPFDNHTRATNPLCSVGLLLDPRQYPRRDDLTAEAEFFTWVSRFPTIAAQLRAGHAVRDWVRTGRIQYGTSQVVGDRWALLGHAAGFIDPFYSKGLYASLTAVSILAHLLTQAKVSGDYSAHTFQPLQTVTLNFLSTADRLIANSYKSFKNYKLWQVYAVQWLLGAYTELVKLNMLRAGVGQDHAKYYQQLYGLKLAGGGFAEFEVVAALVDALIEAVDPYDETAVDKTVVAIKRIFMGLDWLPQPFIALLDGKTYLPKNKIRLSLLKRDSGFMGKGAYREHFFGGMTMADILRYGVSEKVRFAAPVLSLKHRQMVGI